MDILHRKWKKRKANRKNENPINDGEEEIQNKDTRKQVFISYASEDLDAANKIKEALKSQGVTVWMDKERLNGGDLFEQKIREAIKDCCVFIPVISKHTIKDGRRFFRLEWNIGIEVSRMWPPSYPYIQPLVIDDTSTEEKTLPHEFLHLHWNRYDDGEVDQVFVTKLIRMLNRYKQRAKLA